MIYISGEGRGDPPWKGSGDFGIRGKVSFGSSVIMNQGKTSDQLLIGNIIIALQSQVIECVTISYKLRYSWYII